MDRPLGTIELRPHEDSRTFKRTPDHDWASHAADAWRYLSLAWDFPAKPRAPKPPEPMRGVRLSHSQSLRGSIALIHSLTVARSLARASMATIKSPPAVNRACQTKTAPDQDYGRAALNPLPTHSSPQPRMNSAIGGPIKIAARSWRSPHTASTAGPRTFAQDKCDPPPSSTLPNKAGYRLEKVSLSLFLPLRICPTAQYIRDRAPGNSLLASQPMASVRFRNTVGSNLPSTISSLSASRVRTAISIAKFFERISPLLRI